MLGERRAKALEIPSTQGDRPAPDAATRRVRDPDERLAPLGPEALDDRGETPLPARYGTVTRSRTTAVPHGVATRGGDSECWVVATPRT